MWYSLHRSSHKGHRKELWQGSTTVYTPSKQRYRFLLSTYFRFLLALISHPLGKGPSRELTLEMYQRILIFLLIILSCSLCAEPCEERNKEQ